MLKTNLFFSQIFNKKAVFLAVLATFLGIGSIAFSTYFRVSGETGEQSNNRNAKAVAQTCPTCSPPTQQTIYVPTIGLPEATGNEIVLNCRSA